MNLIFNIVVMISAEPTHVAMMPVNPYEYGAIRAMRDMGPEYYRIWWETRCLIGIPESDDPDAVTV